MTTSTANFPSGSLSCASRTGARLRANDRFSRVAFGGKLKSRTGGRGRPGVGHGYGFPSPWRTRFDGRITGTMTDGPVDKIEAARLQLAHALRILDSEDVVAHTLTWAVYCLLRDLLKLDLSGLERALRIGEVPGYFSHAKSDPNDILLVHSPATLQLTMTSQSGCGR